MDSFVSHWPHAGRRIHEAALLSIASITSCFHIFYPSLGSLCAKVSLYEMLAMDDHVLYCGYRLHIACATNSGKVKVLKRTRLCCEGRVKLNSH